MGAVGAVGAELTSAYAKAVAFSQACGIDLSLLLQLMNVPQGATPPTSTPVASEAALAAQAAPSSAAPSVVPESESIEDCDSDIDCVSMDIDLSDITGLDEAPVDTADLAEIEDTRADWAEIEDTLADTVKADLAEIINLGSVAPGSSLDRL